LGFGRCDLDIAVLDLVDFTDVTERPGLMASREQLARLYQRYRFARKFAHGKVVLEVACGSGMGLLYLADAAQRAVGLDIDARNLRAASGLERNGRAVCVHVADAQALPYPATSFDLVVNYEAIYYLAEPERFVAEAARVLRPGGVLLVGTVNRDWSDFHPSPLSRRYFSVPELFDLLSTRFPQVELYGGFRVQNNGVTGRVVSLLKRAAVRLDLIPGSLQARAYLKRLFMGPLQPLPEQVRDGMCAYEPPTPIPVNERSREYKILYAVATKAGAD